MLVFSLRRGEAFYVGDQKVQLIDYSGQGAVLLTRGKKFACGNEPTPLPSALEGITVSAGQRGEHSVRIGIEAPLDIKVLRERLYLRDRATKTRPRKKGPRRLYAVAIDCEICKGTMMCKQEDEEGNTVLLPCPKKQNPDLPVCKPKG